MLPPKKKEAGLERGMQLTRNDDDDQENDDDKSDDAHSHLHILPPKGEMLAKWRHMSKPFLVFEPTT